MGKLASDDAYIEGLRRGTDSALTHFGERKLTQDELDWAVSHRAIVFDRTGLGCSHREVAQFIMGARCGLGTVESAPEQQAPTPELQPQYKPQGVVFD